MSSPDVVLSLAEVGSSTFSALLSSHSTLALPAASVRSFSCVRSLHKRARAPQAVVPLTRLRWSVSAQRRLSSHSSLTTALWHRPLPHSCRSFASQTSTSASGLSSASNPSHSNDDTASSPPPARQPTDFDFTNVSDVANPRLFQSPSFISDAAHLLSSDQRTHLSLRLDELHSQLGTQLAVVTVRSVTVPESSGARGIRDWAVRLFNQWGVGRRQQNDGILVLLVERQRRLEIVLGDGCQQQYGLTNAEVHRVLHERMVPWLQQNEFGMGLVEGVSALEQLIRQSQHDKLVQGRTTLVTEQKPSTEQGVGGGGSGDSGSGSGGGTGWGGGGARDRPSVSPFIIRGALAIVAGFIALQALVGSSNHYSTSSTSHPNRCSRCQGKLKLVGVVDRNNLTASTASDSSALQCIDRRDQPSSTASTSFPPFPSDDLSPFTVVERNLYQADYRVDYQHALDSLSSQQAERLRQPGVLFQVYVCPDCSTLYLQESEADDRRLLSSTDDRSFDRTPYMGVGGQSGGYNGRLGGVVGGAAAGDGSARQPDVVWLQPAERHVKGVRRGSDMGGMSSGGSGGGFGGGSSSGGGAGASF